MFYVIGLGNPGVEYENSRHNTGKMAVEYFRSKISETKAIKIIDSREFMNNSGRAVVKFVKTKNAAKNLIVIHDDIDLPLGTIKISYNKGTGGHRGLDSIVRAVKTKEFIRIRIGISPTTASGKLKKPQGEKKILDFILGDFKPQEELVLKKIFKKTNEAIETIVSSGHDRAMNEFN